MKQTSSLQRQHHRRRPSVSASVSLAEPTRLFAPVTTPFSPLLPHERRERTEHVAQFRHTFDRISIRPPVPDRDAGYEVEPSGVQQIRRQAESQEGEALQKVAAPSQVPQNQTSLPDAEQQEETGKQVGSQEGEALQRVAAPSQAPQNQMGLPDASQQEEAEGQAESQEGEALQRVAAPSQAPQNRTGLPDSLKAGVESLSGLSLDNVRVHYHSAKPAQVDALAYTQGTEIHVGPGQERHLPHEAWHVVQQMQGRVRPTLQTKGVAINDDQGLEREADVMGLRAANNQIPVQAKTMTTIPAQSDTSIVLSMREQDAIQRVMPSDLQEPASYMTVFLQATLNGHDLGRAWSRRTAYSQGSEHAEDALIDYIQALQWGVTLESDDEVARHQEIKAGNKVIVINNLTASPCSSTYGTCGKGDIDGCAERLVELVRDDGFTITVNADHYYQPHGVDNAKQKSRDACAYMRANGITVNIARE